MSKKSASEKLVEANDRLTKKISEQEKNAQHIEVLRAKDAKLKSDVVALRKDVVIARWEEFSEFLQDNGLTMEDIRQAVLNGIFKGNSEVISAEEKSKENSEISDEIFEKNEFKQEDFDDENGAV